MKLSPLFSNGMILQQGVQIPVSGEAASGAEIEVSLQGKIYKTRADSNGKWRLLLDTQTAGGPHTMEIGGSAYGEKLRIDDIYFGDVWLCSGQSNMEMLMQRVKDNFPEEWEKPVNPQIRQFKVPQEWEFSGPRQNFFVGCGPMARWDAASNKNLHEFSAAAWFFANALFEKHHTPIGLINTAWGGTPIEAWMSRESLAMFPEKIACGDQYASDAFREKLTRESEAAIKAWNDEVTAGDSGLAHDWQSGQWDGEPTPLPGNFSESGLNNFCGSIWLRREFDVSEDFAAQAAGKECKVWLGTIVDSDTVYVNGVAVGNTGYRYPPRKYTIPAGLLHKGKNQIVIRVVCNNGEGGVTGDKPFRIFSGSDSVELSGTWEYRVGTRMITPCSEQFFFQRQPMGLFNAMIAPLLDFPCKGVIWYQGESNDPNPREYSALFTAMINDWRGKMTNNALPFLFVQLPIFGEPQENTEPDSWAILREAQASALSLPATGMAAGLELGEWNDLHPMDKKGIGRRLALAAEKVIYNEANTSPGPLLRDIYRRESRLLLTFDNCGAGLAAREQPYVTVIAGRQSFRLPADIVSPNSISVDISGITGAEKVLYAWANNPRDRQLYNADGLPVIPFRATPTAQK